MALTWPADLAPVEATFGLVDLVGTRLESPWTRTVQEVGHGRARWRATLSLPPLDPGQQTTLQAVLDATALDPEIDLPLFDWPAAAGTLTAAVATASAGAVALALTSCVPSLALVRAGDRLAYGGRVYVATADAEAVAGAMTVAVQPPVREALAGVALVLDPAAMRLRLALDGPAPATVAPGLAPAGPAPQVRGLATGVVLDLEEWW